MSCAELNFYVCQTLFQAPVGKAVTLSLERARLHQFFSKRLVPAYSLKTHFEGMWYTQNRLPCLIQDGCAQILRGFLFSTTNDFKVTAYKSK